MEVKDNKWEEMWENLIFNIKKKKCTPIIGPELSNNHIIIEKNGEKIPIINEIIDDWSQKFPLESSSSQLSRLAQYIAIENANELAPKNILARRIEEIEQNDDFPNFRLEKYRNTPYAILADLNLPVYITTNYDHLMEKALKDKGKPPNSDFCIWNEALSKSKNIGTKIKRTKDKDKDKTFVFHLHGDINEPLTMVLTERDLIDFAIYITKELSAGTQLFPTIIFKSLSDNTLLFLGYQLQDINFLVTFQSVIKSIAPTDERQSIAVQLNTNVDEKKKIKIEKYLEEYTQKAFNIRIYWGDVNEFAKEILKRLQ